MGNGLGVPHVPNLLWAKALARCATTARAFCGFKLNCTRGIWVYCLAAKFVGGGDGIGTRLVAAAYRQPTGFRVYPDIAAAALGEGLGQQIQARLVLQVARFALARLASAPLWCGLCLHFAYISFCWRAAIMPEQSCRRQLLTGTNGYWCTLDRGT